MQQIVYYCFSLLLLFAGLMVISVRNPVHAAMFLVLAFFCAAGVWLLLHAEFLAILLVLIYVGAVMVLFLFVVMMLDIDLAPLHEGFVRHLLLGLGVAVTLFLSLWWLLRGVGEFHIMKPGPGATSSETGNTQLLGELLFERYYYAFELAGALLLVASVAAIGLTLRRRRAPRAPTVPEQLRARRDDRVRLVRLDPVKPGKEGDDA